MEEMIPLFPLKLVAFPGEKLNLHIFEPRYKELINDILPGDRRFGIPSFVRKKIEYGTLMEVLEVTRVYKDGRMDIKTGGVKIFRILDYDNPYQDKKYSAGNVQYLENHFDQDPLQRGYLIEKMEEFYRCTNLKTRAVFNDDFISYDIIHHLGLPIEEEYKLLQMNRETDRQEYITAYLDRVLPVLKKTQKAKEIVKMNGHFRYLDPINF